MDVTSVKFNNDVGFGMISKEARCLRRVSRSLLQSVRKNSSKVLAHTWQWLAGMMKFSEPFQNRSWCQLGI